MSVRTANRHDGAARAACAVSVALAALLSLGACDTPPPGPSPQGVRDTTADFMPPGSSMQGARRLVVTVDPARMQKPGTGYAGTFTLANRGSKTVILASIVTASNHVLASMPGAMPFRVDPGKSFTTTVRVNLPWDRAMSDGGMVRVLTTDGETINLWLQLVSDAPVSPNSAGNPPINPPDTAPRSPQPSGWR